MFRLVTFATLFAVVLSAPQHQQARYPAGVDPSKCPGFPICDNAALHNQAPAPQHWQQPAAAAHWQQPAPVAPQWNQWQQPAPVAPQWNQWQQPASAAPQWNQHAVPQYNHIEAVAAKGGDKYPAGVDPRTCPNFPYCEKPIVPGTHSAYHHQPAPLPGFTERLYPAGVSPASCPNYPEC
ncbi:hypothetical protein PVAND_012235 [Polypedilum vanderplanki]|uniref:Cuticle protein CPCFC domain-containing protein n=1 Tax=Polypedilum vanderplanki TaxID=319348 RepID=A0A9J6CLS9_POLVA|nr:hypothetical protein PVAND_012235 [Polypedilum vanderplanki]